MDNSAAAVRITDDVYWVGAIDRDLRDFHGYSTERGTTYNAFLIRAEKVALIDTVRAPFFDEMMARIASVIEPSQIDYIVSNHSEMDHTGCLPQTIASVQPEKVFASANGLKALAAHFHMDLGATAVADGETVSLGNRTLAFYETRMLHWPDSMFCYLPEEEMLFSQDGFGMHLASDERFADEIDPILLREQTAKYYANILLPFSPMVKIALEKAAGLRIGAILPDHGPVWRKNPGLVIEWYGAWAAQKPAPKALIVYDTMWHSTAAMAGAVADGLRAEAIEPVLCRASDCHRSNIATEYLECGALVVGTPTLNASLFPAMADVLSYLKGLKRKNLIGAVFGSYGWNGEGVAQAKEALAAMKIPLVAEPVSVQYVPDDPALERCRALGREIAIKMKESLLMRGCE